VSLEAFGVSGEPLLDDEGEEIEPGDPQRSLLRWAPDGSERYVNVRMNVPLLSAAAGVPVVRLEPATRPDELMAHGRMLTPAGYVRTATLVEDLCAALTASGCPARFLAWEAGHGRRDAYFATQDPACLQEQLAAVARGADVTTTQHSLADLAPLLLPRELVGDLGLPVAPGSTWRTRFEFWGAGESLQRLSTELGSRGFEHLELELGTRELRVAKAVPIDATGFNAVLREIAPLARSLQCSYRGTETVGGPEQFALTHPLPERYAAPGAGGFWKRLFS
jgi:hypothetical protein